MCENNTCRIAQPEHIRRRDTAGIYLLGGAQCKSVRASAGIATVTFQASLHRPKDGGRLGKAGGVSGSWSRKLPCRYPDTERTYPVRRDSCFPVYVIHPCATPPHAQRMRRFDRKCNRHSPDFRKGKQPDYIKQRQPPEFRRLALLARNELRFCRSCFGRQENFLRALDIPAPVPTGQQSVYAGIQ